MKLVSRVSGNSEKRYLYLVVACIWTAESECSSRQRAAIIRTNKLHCIYSPMRSVNNISLWPVNALVHNFTPNVYFASVRCNCRIIITHFLYLGPVLLISATADRIKI